MDHLSSPRNIQLMCSTPQYVWNLSYRPHIRERERKEGHRVKGNILVGILEEFLKLPHMTDTMIRNERDNFAQVSLHSKITNTFAFNASLETSVHYEVGKTRAGTWQKLRLGIDYRQNDLS